MTSLPSSAVLRRSLRVGLAGLCLLAAIGAPRLARACSPPRSCDAVLPGDGGSVPASAPGIPLATSQLFSDVAESPGLELRTTGGSVIAGELANDKGTRFFRPFAPLAPGAYQMTVQNGCAGAAGTTFTVMPAQPIPTRVGTLSVARAGRQAGRAVTSSGSCSEDIDAGVVDLAIELDAKTAPYGDVLEWTLNVDGKPFSSKAGKLSTLEATDTWMHGILRVFTACDSGSRGRSNGLAAGIHDLELKATLVGSTAIVAPATLRVKVTCGSDNGEVLAAVVPPATTAPTDPPAVPGTPPPTGGTGTGGVGTDSKEPSSTSGCSASAASSSGSTLLGGTAVTAALLGLLAARSRRRSLRPAHSR